MFYPVTTPAYSLLPWSAVWAETKLHPSLKGKATPETPMWFGWGARELCRVPEEHFITAANQGVWAGWHGRGEVRWRETSVGEAREREWNEKADFNPDFHFLVLPTCELTSQLFSADSEFSIPPLQCCASNTPVQQNMQMCVLSVLRPVKSYTGTALNLS